MSDSVVLSLNTDGLDLSDIKDTGHDMLTIEPKVDKQAVKAQKEQAKAQKEESKALAKIAREDAKDAKKAAKEKLKIEQAGGLFGGTSAQELRVKICKFKAHKKFGKVLKEQKIIPDNKVLDRMDESQLSDVLERVRFTVCNLNAGNMYKGIANTVVGAGEELAVGMGYQVQGLTATLNRSDEYNDLIEEIMIERGLLVYTKPEYRLVYLVLSTGYSLHAARSTFNSLPEEEKQKLLGQYAASLPQQSSPQTNPQSNLPDSTAIPDDKPTVEDFNKNRRKHFESRFGDLLA